MDNAQDNAPQHSPRRDDQALPLTERVGDGAAGTVTEAEIRILVDSFYESVRGDRVLGPIFARHVKDWSLHLPKMYDFWSTVVLRTGRYSGRPFEAHRAIPDLGPAHFARWLEMWEDTVTHVFEPGRTFARGAFVAAAHRMGASMAARLQEA